jgi:hypothetical protein
MNKLNGLTKDQASMLYIGLTLFKLELIQGARLTDKYAEEIGYLQSQLDAIIKSLNEGGYQ